MRKRRLLPIVAVSIMVLGSLTACGEDTATSSQEKTTTTAAAEMTATAAETDKTTTAESKAGKTAEGEYVYGTLNLNYANYYYGELNDIEPEDSEISTTGQYDKADLVNEAGLEEEGMYDAVTSATTTKSKAFGATFTEDTETGANILGPSNVNVAISKLLYEDAKKAIEDGVECKNQLLELVGNLENISEEAPAEYKVINSDGTISKTIGETKKAEGVTAEITTTSTWGNYEIDLEGLEVETDGVQGVVMETSDGVLYGLQHLDNIWLQANELAFSVEEFTDPHDNVAGYKRFEDIQGKTITKITYLIGNGDDIEIETSLFCKEQLADEYMASCPETVLYSNTGTEIAIAFTVPEDSSYVISDVVKSRNSLDEGSYQLENGVVTLNSDCKPGEYKLVFSDEKYADLAVTCQVTSGLNDGDVIFNGTNLSVNENAGELTVADYIGGITTVSVNGNALSGQNPGTSIFNEDGSVNFDAVIKSRQSETKVFEGSDSYTLEIKAIGYPDLEMTVTP